jgi:hypothetical protein
MRQTFAVYEAEIKLPCRRLISGEVFGDFECGKHTTGRVVEMGVHLPICGLHMPNVEAQRVLVGDELLALQHQIATEEYSLPSRTETYED